MRVRKSSAKCEVGQAMLGAELIDMSFTLNFPRLSAMHTQRWILFTIFGSKR